MTYEKITRKTWNWRLMKETPKYPSKGAFEVTFEGRTLFVVDGELHRTDGPAVIFPDGTQKYYQNGKLHREDGPAVTFLDGTQYYYHWDRLHRTDGPATILDDGNEEYYLFGQYCQKEEWELRALQLSLKEQIL